MVNSSANMCPAMLLLCDVIDRWRVIGNKKWSALFGSDMGEKPISVVFFPDIYSDFCESDSYKKLLKDS